MSFAGLLGEFYGLWTMRRFTPWVFPPAVAALVIIAWKSAPGNERPSRPRTWVVEGALGGIVSAVVYDLYRLPFVLAGTPLFDVFPQFGTMILGGEAPVLYAQFVGWVYHFSNGAALGVMFLAGMPGRSRRSLFIGAIAWACCVEALLLMTPYAQFFGIDFNGWFIFLTASAHIVFGVALGAWCASRIGAG